MTGAMTEAMTGAMIGAEAWGNERESENEMTDAAA